MKCIDTFKRCSDGVLRKMIIESIKSKKDIIDTFKAVGARNEARGWELYNNCPVIEGVLNQKRAA